MLRNSLANELASIQLDQRYPIYITHTKPVETELIMAEIERFNGSAASGKAATVGQYDIRWLRTGQVVKV